MRLLGVVYLIAFVSWWVQLDGLSGSRGITPTATTLEFLQNQLGLETFADYATQVPTLLWFDSSDRTLHGLCAAGVILALLVVVRVCVGPALVLLWAAYLSMCAADAVFLGFQWENLLLEAGFLAIFWAPWRPRPRLKTDSEPGWPGRWLLGWLNPTERGQPLVPPMVPTTHDWLLILILGSLVAAAFLGLGFAAVFARRLRLPEILRAGE